MQAPSARHVHIRLFIALSGNGFWQNSTAAFDFSAKWGKWTGAEKDIFASHGLDAADQAISRNKYPKAKIGAAKRVSRGSDGRTTIRFATARDCQSKVDALRVATVMLRPAVTVFATLAPLLLAKSAFACATCNCGDPTLTLMGNEKSFEGRLRVSVEERLRTERDGTRGLDEQHIGESRSLLGAWYAPTSRWSVAGFLPLVYRRVTNFGASPVGVVGLGDLELQAKAIVFRDREFASRHVLSLIAGLGLPTASRTRGSDGKFLDVDFQPGFGSFIPNAGGSYGFYRYPWSVYAATRVYFPTVGWDSFLPGLSSTSELSFQYQPQPWLGLLLGIEGKLAGFDRTGEQRDPSSGGFAGYVLAGAIFSPTTDLLLHLSVRVPALNFLNGNRSEGPMLSAGVVYDFDLTRFAKPRE